MRTTLTLDEDVYAKLQEEVRRTRRSFKETVNECLRVGLQKNQQPRTTPFRIRAEERGFRVGLDYDCAWDLIERLEGSQHR